MVISITEEGRREAASLVPYAFKQGCDCADTVVSLLDQRAHLLSAEQAYGLLIVICSMLPHLGTHEQDETDETGPTWNQLQDYDDL